MRWDRWSPTLSCRAAPTQKDGGTEGEMGSVVSHPFCRAAPDKKGWGTEVRRTCETALFVFFRDDQENFDPGWLAVLSRRPELPLLERGEHELSAGKALREED